MPDVQVCYDYKKQNELCSSADGRQKMLDKENFNSAKYYKKFISKDHVNLIYLTVLMRLLNRSSLLDVYNFEL